MDLIQRKSRSMHWVPQIDALLALIPIARSRTGQLNVHFLQTLLCPTFELLNGLERDHRLLCIPWVNLVSRSLGRPQLDTLTDEVVEQNLQFWAVDYHRRRLDLKMPVLWQTLTWMILHAVETMGVDPLRPEKLAFKFLMRPFDGRLQIKCMHKRDLGIPWQDELYDMIVPPRGQLFFWKEIHQVGGALKHSCVEEFRHQSGVRVREDGYWVL